MNAKRWRKAGAAAALSMLLASSAGAYQMFGGEPVSATPASEYFNEALGEYLVTTSPDEIAALESRALAGWARSKSVAFYTLDAPAAAVVDRGAVRHASPVCRFFLPPASHFLSASPQECAVVAESSAGAVLETEAAFYAWLPNAAGGCPRLFAKVGGFSFAPVYRLWDGVGNGHRLTASKAERDAMAAEGWVPEGYGSEGVAMCVPSWSLD